MDEIDIPEAIRDTVEIPKQSRSFLSLPLIIGGILCFGVLLLLFLFFSPLKSTQNTVTKSLPQASSEKPLVESDSPNNPTPTPDNPTPIRTKSNTTEQPANAKPNTEKLLGHLPYDVAPQSDLQAITADGRLKLRSAATAKFRQMQAAAQAEGIILTPISAFRNIEDQEQLFFGIKEQRVQDAAKRAEVSAPPGYSEHHTGYAIDIGDGNAPATNVEPEFADTAAFGWLQKNALKYSFELSFPPDNEQGVSYEPWHWRFVGDRHSLETFYKVRN